MNCIANLFNHVRKQGQVQDTSAKSANNMLNSLHAWIGKSPLLASLLAAALGFGGVAVCWWAEITTENMQGSMLGLVLYLIGIGLFASGYWLLSKVSGRKGGDPASSSPDDIGAEKSAPSDIIPAGKSRWTFTPRTRWLILWSGMGIGVLLCAYSLFQLYQDIKSPVGAYGWLVSVLIMIGTGFAVSKGEGWTPRWNPSIVRGRRLMALIVLAVVVILVVSCLTRLTGLDKVPLGINADEGDQAAVALQIIHGDNHDSIFSNGWYWISMVYFYLLASVMQIVGTGFDGARVLGALAGIASVTLVTIIGIRHWGVRVGLLAGGVLSVLAVALQFSRETTVAAPTATLWALSSLLLFEGSRTGKSWAWIIAGLAGGLTLYFYPSGRLWAILAGVYFVYLLVHGLGGNRQGILRGAVLCAVCALAAGGPFLVESLKVPEQLVLRAKETSVFTAGNATRLHYYQTGWSTPQLMAAQLDHSMGIFSQYHDDGGFWPTDKPITDGILAALTLLGIGWAAVRVRDPRFVLLSLWFWCGMLGAIVTVETPNLHRMVTAIPTIGLFVALVLNALAEHIEAVGRALGSVRTARLATGLGWAGGIATVLLLAYMQYQVYFVQYAASDRWPQPTWQGKAVADQGTDTLTITLARQYHMVNSGWVRVLAQGVPRAGMQNPGQYLPLDIPPDHNLSFLISPVSPEYMPYVQALYPGGTVTAYTHPTEGVVFTAYKISKEQWQQTTGAWASGATSSVSGSGGQSASTDTSDSGCRVPSLGSVPPCITQYPAKITWKAGLRVPEYSNYTFRTIVDSVEASIDGYNLVGDKDTNIAAVSLAAGWHSVWYTATVKGQDDSHSLEWARVPNSSDTSANTSDASSEPQFEWKTPQENELSSVITRPMGLAAHTVFTEDNKEPEGHRVDGTIAFCCLSPLVGATGRKYVTEWSGTLNAPTTSIYTMTLLSESAVQLTIDGKDLVNESQGSNKPYQSVVELTKGPHSVLMRYSSAGETGYLQWDWQLPGQALSIVSPFYLSPTVNDIVGPPVQDLRPPRDKPDPIGLDKVP